MKIKQFQYIDCLKGLAVLGVISVHCLGLILPNGEKSLTNLPLSIEYLFNFGQLGVQLFFMASAITLCQSVGNRQESTWLFFFMRRFFRIWPLYCCGIILYCAIHYFSAQKTSVEIKDIIFNLLLLHGLIESANNSVVPGGWSIGTEVLFYLLFPVLYGLLLKKSLPKLFTYSSTIVLLCLLVEVAGNLRPDVNVFYYRLILNQLSVFIIGICTYRMLEKAPGVASILLSITLILSACYLFNQTYKPAFNLFLIPILACAGFAILIIRLHKFFDQTQLFIWTWLARLGKISYSAYLFHFCVIWVLSLTIQAHLLSLDSQIFALLITTTLVTGITFCIASVTYRVIERPSIRLGERIIEHMQNKLS